MNDLDKLGVVIRYEFLKHIRRARLYIILGIALLAEALVLILVPALMEGGYPDNVRFMAVLLTVGPSMAALGAVFFAGDAIAGEYETKTGFLLFTNPIKKETLWIGKYLASFIAVALLMVFTYIIIAVSLLVIYQQVPVEIFQSFGLALFYAAATLSTTFFFSALSRGSMGATIMTLVFIWVICGILQSVLLFTGNPYWYVLSAGGDSIANVYGNMNDFMAGFGGFGGLGGGGAVLDRFKPPTLAMASWGMAIYFVGGFVGSIFLARRRQLA
jgi:ABC-2 type transport system permease protein